MIPLVQLHERAAESGWIDLPSVFGLGKIWILILISVFGSLQLFFTGLLGEYIMSVNARVMRRPPVIEEARMNFDKAPGK